MKWLLLLFVGFMSLPSSFGQLPKKVQHLEGVWRYKEGSGYESWKLEDDQLVGVAYRINAKTNDSTRVEDSWIRMVNKNLVYTIQSYHFVADSMASHQLDFIGSKRKLKFTNIHESGPNVISYSFGFFNKNKLILKIYYEEGESPVKLVLNKVRR